MSENPFEKIEQKFDEVKQKPQVRKVINEAEPAVEASKNFYESNDETIKALVIVGVVLLVNRWLTRRVVRKEISNLAEALIVSLTPVSFETTE